MKSKWLLGYKDGLWKTIEIPETFTDKLVESMLLELNQQYDIVYVRVVNGIAEKNNHKTKKGEFLGL
jgi:hypothetical protein